MPFCMSYDNVKSAGDRNKISLNKKPLRCLARLMTF